MFTEEQIAHVKELASKPVALGGWLGLPYIEKGCIKFLPVVFEQLGLHFTADNILKDVRRFHRVKDPQFGDIAVFKDLPFDSYHVAFMLDYRRAIQSSVPTNGVGKIDIRRYPFADAWREFLRLKDV